MQIEVVFKKAFEDSRKSLKAKFASQDRLVTVSSWTQDVHTGAVPEVQVEDEAPDRQCQVEAAFGGMNDAEGDDDQGWRQRQVDEAFRRMQEHDQIRQQLCPMDAEEGHELVQDAPGGEPQFVASAEDADAHTSAAVASGLEQGSLICDDYIGGWSHEIVW